MPDIAADTASSDALDLNLFFHAARDLFCIAGFDGYFKKVNPAVIETLGYSEKELFSRPVNDFIHPEDRELTEIRRKELREAKVLSNFENRYLTKSGQVVWLSWTSVPHPKLQLVFAVAKNITLRKIEESKREQVIDDLNASRQELKDLVYTALHDLRAPLGSMMSIFDIYGELSEPAAPYGESLSILKASISDLKVRMDAYFERLIKSRTVIPDYTEASFQQALDRVRTSLSALLRETGTTINVDFSLAGTAPFDETYLESIFLNLISNSLKYAQPGVAPVIDISSRDAADFVELTVKDNGLGFDQNEIGDRLFQFQQRFHPQTEGKGVGLYLVKSHLAQFGGSIRAASQPGKGTTFTIAFKKRG